MKLAHLMRFEAAGDISPSNWLRVYKVALLTTVFWF